MRRVSRHKDGSESSQTKLQVCALIFSRAPFQISVMDHYILNLKDDHSLRIPSDLKIIFLCGVLFNRRSDKDKRRVLKKYLLENEQHYPLILEESFSNPVIYGDIDLRNLHDVEMLVACFANATIIIHESLSTSAELGMFASNKSTASKLLILHPDRDSVEEDKIGGFIKLAFFNKNGPILPEGSVVPFSPVVRKNYETNDRYVYYTGFPNNLGFASRARDSIDDFLAKPGTEPLSKISFVKPKYNTPASNLPATIDYYEDGETLYLYVSPMALRALLFSLLSLEHVRKRVTESTSISKVLTALQEELNKLLLSTHNHQMGEAFSSIKIHLKGLELATFQDESTDEYRKGVGLFVYLLKAMGYLASEDNKKFKFTRDFAAIRDKFKGTIAIEKKSAFAKHMQKASES